MEPEDIKGKKIKEIIDKDTQICDKLTDNWDDDVIIQVYKSGTIGNITVLYGDDYVFIFDKKKLKAIFYVYDLAYVTTNDKRGFITAGGHETVHEYWLDDGEYHKEHTR